MKRRLKRMTSLFLALVMAFTMLPLSALAELAAEKPSDAAVSALAKLYDGDENRARSDLEALYASGLIDADGNMVALDIREDGESVELAALTERIANGDSVGAITVNGGDATPEQIVQISQVNAAIEIAQLLDEEIDVTDEHVENLESLLTGIENGDVDLESALETGSMRLLDTNDNASLMSGDESRVRVSTAQFNDTLRMSGDESSINLYIAASNDTALHGKDEFNRGIYDYYYAFPSGVMPSGGGSMDWYTNDTLYALDADEVKDDKTGYYDRYISGSGYEANHFFEFENQELLYKAYYYSDWRYSGSTVGDTATSASYNYIDWANAKWGTDGNEYRNTVTVVLPLKTGTTGFIETISSLNPDTTAINNGLGMEMELPDYGKVTITAYLRDAYFSTNRDSTIRYPVYLVYNGGENPVAFATRFATDNSTFFVRRDMVNLHLGTSGSTYLPGWSEVKTDKLGYYYSKRP